MNKAGYYLSTVIMMILLATSCSSEYDQYVKREMNSGVKNDSLLFDIKIGETQKDFFAKCWELNKQQIISQGTGNKTVRYTEPMDSTAADTLRKDLLFYALFDDEKNIVGMDMSYSYLTWALWNKDRHSDKLAERLTEEFVHNYGGNPFIQIELEATNSLAYVKIDGNRQILIYPKNNKDVVVKMEDLNYKYANK